MFPRKITKPPFFSYISAYAEPPFLGTAQKLSFFAVPCFFKERLLTLTFLRGKIYIIKQSKGGELNLKLEISDGARRIIKILNLKGYDAYIVGGAVRDCIMGKLPHDFDIATNALPKEIKSTFPKTVDIGIRHGTVAVMDSNSCYEVTTFRTDGEYHDSRHPDGVNFVNDMSQDMLRRDFTINALAYNDQSGVIDCVGGLSDIENKIIRCVGDPETRFREDALRMLRAVRFCAVLGFEIEEKTAAAIKKCALLIKKISAERIREELEKILRSENPGGIIKLREFGLLRHILPELDVCFSVPQKNKYHIYDVGHHIIHAVSAAPDDIVIRWAALLHDIGKPLCKSEDANGIIHFYGHHRESVRLSDDILHRLHLDNDTRRNILLLIENHDIRIEANPVSVKRVMARLGEELFSKLLLLQEADNTAKNPVYLEDKLSQLNDVRLIYRKVLSERQPYLLSDLVINGRDLIKSGFRAGREIGDTLHVLLDEVIINPSLNTREYLIKRARQLKRKK